MKKQVSKHIHKTQPGPFCIWWESFKKEIKKPV